LIFSFSISIFEFSSNNVNAGSINDSNADKGVLRSFVHFSEIKSF
jgi:hypothetical protein